MDNPRCKKCNIPMSKMWINFVTKWVCNNKKCKNYDKKVNS